jgi:hypothetical protein
VEEVRNSCDRGVAWGREDYIKMGLEEIGWI